MAQPLCHATAEAPVSWQDDFANVLVWYVPRIARDVQLFPQVGTFIVTGKLVNPEYYVGRWIGVDWGRDVCYIYHLTAITSGKDANHWIVKFDGRPGLERTADGSWAHTGYPFKGAGKNAVLCLTDYSIKLTTEFLKAVN